MRSNPLGLFDAINWSPDFTAKEKKEWVERAVAQAKLNPDWREVVEESWFGVLMTSGSSAPDATNYHSATSSQAESGNMLHRNESNTLGSVLTQEVFKSDPLDGGNHVTRSTTETPPAGLWSRWFSALKSRFSKDKVERPTETEALHQDPASSTSEQVETMAITCLPEVAIVYAEGFQPKEFDPDKVWDSLESNLATNATSQDKSSPNEDLSKLYQILNQWAVESGRIIDSSNFRSKFASMGLSRGEEHLVFLDPDSGRVVKVTAGDHYGARGIHQWIHNLRRSNERFGDEIRLIGILANEEFPKLVLSQPFRAGTRPETSDIDTALKAHGYHRVGDKTYYHMGREEAISDAKPANFVKLRSGETLAIDVHFIKPSDRVREVYENIVNSIGT